MAAAYTTMRLDRTATDRSPGSPAAQVETAGPWSAA